MCCTFVQGGEEREERGEREGRARGEIYRWPPLRSSRLLTMKRDESRKRSTQLAGERRQERGVSRRSEAVERGARGRTEAGLLATAEARARLALDAAAVVRASVECAEGWRGRGGGREEERRDAQVPAAVGEGVDLGLEGGLCLLLSEEGLELALCGRAGGGVSEMRLEEESEREEGRGGTRWTHASGLVELVEALGCLLLLLLLWCRHGCSSESVRPLPESPPLVLLLVVLLSRRARRSPTSTHPARLAG